MKAGLTRPGSRKLPADGRVLVFTSGELGFSVLQDLESVHGFLPAGVVTDGGVAGLEAFCELRGIPVYFGRPEDPSARDFLHRHSFGLGLCINYRFLLDEGFLHRFAAPILNIHGSLLPRYRGRTPHVWAIINGEVETGITVHRVDAGCDTGPILSQLRLNISPDDTGGSILQKFRALYPGMLMDALHKLAAGRARFVAQPSSGATYFPRRVPADGVFSVHWDFARIRNWVRAQTRPYPGAFALTEDAGKVTFWKVRLDRVLHGRPGTVLSVGRELRVSCAEGVLVSDDWSCDRCVDAGETLK